MRLSILGLAALGLCAFAGSASAQYPPRPGYVPAPVIIRTPIVVPATPVYGSSYYYGTNFQLGGVGISAGIGGPVYRPYPSYYYPVAPVVGPSYYRGYHHHGHCR